MARQTPAPIVVAAHLIPELRSLFAMMIGVVGPRDSIALAMQVAAEAHLDSLVLPRAYDAVEQAPELARQLDAACHVLLFTGRVPYTLARQAGGLHAVLDFVPHGGVDLYRALVLILHRNGGHLPTVSLDTIDRATVDETYRDLGIAPPQHLLPIEGEGASLIREAEDIVHFHESCYRRGDVELCMTCLGSVRDDLERRGIPVVRVEHTRSALRDALARAALADRLARTEASQVAVAAVDMTNPRDATRTSETPTEPRRRDLRIRQQMLSFAERLQGTLADRGDHLFIVHATRGAIEQEWRRLANEPLPIIVGDARAAIGFGLGATATSAEENARHALTVGRNTGEPLLVLPDGSVLRIQDGAIAPAFQLRDTSQSTLSRADNLGLGSLTLGRMVAALRRVDPGSVTARDLAHAYGVTPRSALRLLGALERAGAATRLGRQVAPRAGRPQTIFRVDVERLLPPH